MQEDSNFRVYVRCRGQVSAISSPDQIPAYEAVSPSEIVRKSDPSKRYQFDKILDESSTQEAVYKECAEPLIDEFLRGYNGTLFAYGQTGTGKTYTVSGECAPPHVSEKAGIIPRVLDCVFKRLVSSKSQDWLLELKYVELYNEEIRDLLSETTVNVQHAKGRSSSFSSQNFKQPRIVENRNNKSIEVVGASSIPVSNLEAALSVVKSASAKRKTAATQLNADSSRSHAILTLILVSREPVSGMAVRSKLHLVDLAGSENVARSGAVRQRAQEAGEINKSLLALGRIIEMLVSSDRSSNNAQLSSSSKKDTMHSKQESKASKPYVSYRESKLTHLLQDSLGGATKTCMVATISLASTNFEESKSTLEYASRARSIRNQTQTEVEVMEMQGTLRGLGSRIEELEQELMMQRNRDGGVYVSAYNYHQLKSNQRKHAELVAQRETMVKHYAIELDDLKQSNAKLLADRESLHSNLQLAKDEILRLSLISDASDEIRGSAGLLKSSLKRYTSGVERIVTILSNKTSELPKKLESIKSDFNLNFQKSRHILKKELDANFKDTVSSYSDSIKVKVQASLESPINTLRDSTNNLIAEVGIMLEALKSNMSHIEETGLKLQRQFDNIQADIAMQQQLNLEMIQATASLQANHAAYEETLGRLSEERTALIQDLIAKQQHSSIPRLSNCASNALELVQNLQDNAQRLRNPDLRPLDNYIASLDFESINGCVQETVQTEMSSLRYDMLESIFNSLNSHDQAVVAQELAKSRDLQSRLNDIKDSLDANELEDWALLSREKEFLTKELTKFQARPGDGSPLRHEPRSLSPTRAFKGNREALAPLTGSARRSPHRILHRSPKKSATKVSNCDPFKMPDCEMKVDFPTSPQKTQSVKVSNAIENDVLIQQFPKRATDLKHPRKTADVGAHRARITGAPQQKRYKTS